MRPIKQWFGLGPGNEDDGREYHWYNGHYEWSGTRVRLIVGDMLAECENENGGHRGPQFTGELSLWQEDIPEFHLPDDPNAKYDVHILNVVFWRWGVYLSVRGPVYP